MKRASIEIDEKLLGEALRATGVGNVNALVDHALRELIRREREKRPLKLKSNVDLQGD